MKRVAQLIVWLLVATSDSVAAKLRNPSDSSKKMILSEDEIDTAAKQPRRLEKIESFGGSPNYVLNLCQGDCDSDSDCLGHLKCFQRGPYTPVPGCQGGESDPSRTDYCIEPNGGPGPTPRPIAHPQPTPTPVPPHYGGHLIYLGNNGHPAHKFPLHHCAGDCDRSSDCAGDLVCFQRGPYEPVPGCIGGEHDSSKTDYCIRSGGPGPTPTLPPRPPTTRPVPTLPPRPPTNRPTPASGPAGTVHFVGNDGYPAHVFPLKACQGDCDRDDDCGPGLKCFQRNGYDRVPHCLGGESDKSAADYCIPDASHPGPTPKPAPGPTLRPTKPPAPHPTKGPTPHPTRPSGPAGTVNFVGNDGYPAHVFPLKACQGDCDRDDDCDPGLKCFQRNAYTRVPHCLGGESDKSATDYCIPDGAPPGPTPQPHPGPTPSPVPQPTPGSTGHVQFVGQDGKPKSSFPLGLCQGDCDRDTDCAGNLRCFQRSKYDPVPGCWGGESDSSNVDYCVHESGGSAPPPPPSNSFRIKMYWQPGYFWQEETRERKWCFMSDYNGYPGPGKCWYGLETRDCNPNHIYIAKCNDDHRQRFTFVPVGSEGEVLIKAGAGQNRCLERYRRTMSLTNCDENNSLQRWHALNGSFDGPRFEISQKGFTSQCVTTAHHPKGGEVVELHDCEASRAKDSETSYWNKY